jgi:hypothetical protein
VKSRPSLSVKRETVREVGLSEFERGVLTGLIIGEGSFTGDRKAAELVIKMHVRHEALMRWIHQRFPRTRLYGPYEHGGRHYFMWIARGRALVEDVLPELLAINELDDHVAARMKAMIRRYNLNFDSGQATGPEFPRTAAA